MMKEFSVKIPLLEALQQMLGYAKFMKDVVTKKRTISYEDDGGLHHCSEIIS